MCRKSKATACFFWGVERWRNSDLICKFSSTIIWHEMWLSYDRNKGTGDVDPDVGKNMSTGLWSLNQLRRGRSIEKIWIHLLAVKASSLSKTIIDLLGNTIGQRRYLVYPSIWCLWALWINWGKGIYLQERPLAYLQSTSSFHVSWKCNGDCNKGPWMAATFLTLFICDVCHNALTRVESDHWHPYCQR